MNDGVRELPEPIEFLESLRRVRASMRIRLGARTSTASGARTRYQRAIVNR